MPLDGFQLFTLIAAMVVLPILYWIKYDRSLRRFSLGTLLYAMTIIALVVGLASTVIRWRK